MFKKFLKKHYLRILKEMWSSALLEETRCTKCGKKDNFMNMNRHLGTCIQCTWLYFMDEEDKRPILKTRYIYGQKEVE